MRGLLSYSTLASKMEILVIVELCPTLASKRGILVIVELYSTLVSKKRILGLICKIGHYTQYDSLLGRILRNLKPRPSNTLKIFMKHM